MLVVLRSTQDTQIHCVKGVLSGTASDTARPTEWWVYLSWDSCTALYTVEVNTTTAASITQKAVFNVTTAICRVSQIYIPIYWQNACPFTKASLNLKLPACAQHHFLTRAAQIYHQDTKSLIKRVHPVRLIRWQTERRGSDTFGEVHGHSAWAQSVGTVHATNTVS